MTADDVMTAMWESTRDMMRASIAAWETAAFMAVECLGLTLDDAARRLRRTSYPEGRDGFPGQTLVWTLDWLDGDAWRTIHRQWWELDGEHTLTLRQEWGLP
ncbi:MAG: hypothetical protein MUF00_01725 [Gemmatimonadaceae bacterium]|jgi:hypothetical protein|nr:hypothetical protein [Gemmatimonadaceae bacterium]